MAVGDVYQIKDFQVFGSQELMNVYYYRSNDAAITASDFEQPFFNHVLLEVADFQTGGLQHTALEIENLFDPTDFATATTGVPGDRAIQPLAAFYAISYRLNRQRRDMHHGYKRYAGIPEDAVNGGQIDNTWAYVAELNQLITVLADNLNQSAVAPIDADPVVVQRERYQTSSGSFAYRLPLSQATLVYYVVSSVTLQGPTTQNTRKN